MRRQMLVLLTITILAVACGPTKPAPTPTPTPTPLPTLPQPTPTSTPPVEGEIEGLVLTEDGQLIIGVNWLSKSRVTYRVTGGELERLRALQGETVRVSGQIVEHSLWLKEITVRTVQVSNAKERLSMRRGYIKELGPSIYMQGTHLLTDREGSLICLLASAPGGPDLDQYMRTQVMVIGVMEKTVEGNALIMRVHLVEPVK